MIRAFRLIGILASIVGVNSAATIVESYNVGFPQSNIYLSTIDLGWYYTPTQTYDLIGALTTVAPITNGPTDANSPRTVTVDIFTDRPAVGGTVLASSTFNYSGQTGTLVGASFSPVQLTAGTTYFIGFENVFHLGNLQVAATNNNAGPAGSVALGDAYYDNGGGQFELLGSDTSTWFAKPIIEFLGPDAPPTATPEPSSIALLLAGAGVLLLVRKRTLGRA